MDIAILLSICALTQFGSHYLPWQRLNHGRPIPRPVAYTIGVIGLLVPLSAWLVIVGETWLIWIIWSVALAAGLGTVAGYGLDWILSMRETARAKSEEAELLRKQRDAQPTRHYDEHPEY